MIRVCTCASNWTGKAQILFRDNFLLEPADPTTLLAATTYVRTYLTNMETKYVHSSSPARASHVPIRTELLTDEDAVASFPTGLILATKDCCGL